MKINHLWVLCTFILRAVASPSWEYALPQTKKGLEPLRVSHGAWTDSTPAIGLRSLKDWHLMGLIIVTDIDGNLHGVDRSTGALRWTLPIEELLVSIQRNDSDSPADQTSSLLWLVEPFGDGLLYYFTPSYGLNKLPTSIKNLVMESPFSLTGDDKIYTGTRKTSLYTIDVYTGEIVSQFGGLADDEACPAANVHQGPVAGQNPNYVMMGKTTYELTIHSTLDSNVVWNVTYSLWGPNNINTDLALQNTESEDRIYFTPFYDKSVLAVSQDRGTPLWISKFLSLAVYAFDIFCNSRNGDELALLPHPMSYFNSFQHDADVSANVPQDTCFINKTAHSNEWFAMSYANYPTLIKSAPVSPYQQALSDFDEGSLPDEVLDVIKHMNVSTQELEQFVSGVHKLNFLTSMNLYQPASKFTEEDHKHLPDSLDAEREESANNGLPVKNSADQLPILIDGIYFPITQKDPAHEVATLDGSQSLSSPRETEHTYNPIKYGPTQEQMGPARESVSVFRRILEDLLVMTTLLLFFFAFNKVRQIMEDSKVANDSLTFSKPSEEKPKVELEHDETQPGDAEDVIDASEEKEIVVADPSGAEESPAVPASNGKVVAEDSNAEDKELESQNDDETELDTQEVVTKKKRKRGSRGGKRGGAKVKKSVKYDDSTIGEIPEQASELESMTLATIDETIQTISLVKNLPKPQTQVKTLKIDNNLVITDKVLGYGSHGTVVFEGSFENRPVAVKRMLLDFYDIANHEVRLLQESDDHPNVVRYFCSQSSTKEKFLYIALELCVCSLDEIIEKQGVYPMIFHINQDSHNSVLYQLASGLNYLHSLKIVHRDLKPQNILVGEITRKKKASKGASIRLLISDFGLCKKLDADQSSFRATAHHAASGTSGWRAPELLLLQDLLEISPDTVSPNGFTCSNSFKDGTAGSQTKRLTRAIDIFSLGCVFYYILSGGGHPFGDRYLREGNIIRGESDILMLKTHCPDDYVEATDLISSMICFNPKSRPDSQGILKHPYFWPINKKLEFLLKVSDRFEVEKRDPPSDLLLELESIALRVHGGDWLLKFDDLFTDNLGKYRKYHTDKMMDLLRALRNKYHHFNDMPPELQSKMSPLPSGFYKYFCEKFPCLLMETYSVVRDHLQDEHVFHEYF